jgi:HEAT repeat protein
VPQLQALYGSTDAGVRKVVVFALGALPGDAQQPTLRAALNDSQPDVQWNAAIALARRGDAEGASVLGQMLDREYVSRVVTRSASPQSDEDPVAEVMVGGLQAVAALASANRTPADGAMRDRVVALSQGDRSMRVRQAALEALKVMTPQA